MIEQASLFDGPAAIARRDEAIGRVQRHADPAWLLEARRVVGLLARELPELTTDDVWERLENKPHEPRALGAVMIWAHKAGFVARTDRTRNSLRPECHRRPLRLWASKLYTGR